MKRKIISLLLAVVMVLSLVPGAVFAEGTGTITIDNGCAHSYGDGTVVAPDCDDFGYTTRTFAISDAM